MPKMVCSRCQLELVFTKMGVSVVEYADFGPYKLWNADELECPGCHVKIVAGFADLPLSHHEHGFQDNLKEIPDEYLRKDFESASQRERFKKAVQDV